MKPIRIDDGVFDRIDMSAYTIEEKLDGFRLILIVDNGVKLYTRQKNQMLIPDNLKSQLDCLSLPDGTILDGEIWNESKRGSWVHDRSSVCYLSFWDIMSFKYEDISAFPIEKRREILSNLVPNEGDIRTSSYYQASKERYKEIKEMSIEFRRVNKSKSGFVHGAVLKRKGSPRRDNVVRSVEHADWLKIVCI